MNKNIHLSIANPCSENWNNMTTTSHGAFCLQCQKEVIDFSKLSDDQILNYFNTTQELTCGKVKSSQLNRMISSSVSNNYKQPHYYQFFIGLFVSTFWNNSALAKTTIFDRNKPNTFFSENVLLSINETKKDSSKNIIKGKVLDKETNEPIPFANVFIKDFGIGVSTDLDGKFSLSIPDSLSKYNLTLKINFLGYESIEFSNINLQMLSKENVYFLKPGEQVIMGALVNSIYIPEIPKKKKWWQRKSK